MDLAPTISEIAGVELARGTAGKSLTGALKNEKTQVRRIAISAYRHYQRAIRTNDSKLIVYNVNGVKTMQLFDLKKDPWELENKALTDPRRVRELMEQLQIELAEMGDKASLGAASWA